MTRLNGSRNSVLWAWFLVNVALFSPIQFHNWLWPMQFAYFLPYTFLTLCLCALYARIAALPKFALAALFALAGNYSFVQGNLIWPAVLPVIVFAPGILAKEARKNFAIAWLLLGALAVTLYFRGLEHNSAAPDYAYGHEGVPPTMSTLHQLQEQPLQTSLHMGRFVIAMFGNAMGRGFPVADTLVFSYVCGAIVLALAIDGTYGCLETRLGFPLCNPLGLPAVVHLSHSGLCLCWESLARRLPTAHSSLHYVRGLVHRCLSAAAFRGIFRT